MKTMINKIVIFFVIICILGLIAIYIPKISLEDRLNGSWKVDSLDITIYVQNKIITEKEYYKSLEIEFNKELHIYSITHAKMKEPIIVKYIINGDIIQTVNLLSKQNLKNQAVIKGDQLRLTSAKIINGNDILVISYLTRKK